MSTGTFAITSPTLAGLGQLTGAGSTYNFASQLFTPSANGAYTFGMSSAPNDTVLILYQGAHNPAAPGTNAVALNDDSDGLGAGGVVMGTCGGIAGLCPKMTETLTGGTDYYVVITTYNAGAPVTLPIDFYVYGEPVGVGGAAPPAGISVLGSSTTLANTPAYGGAAVIDATPGLLALFTGAGLSTDDEISDAASQTLPLLTGGSMIAAGNALSGINRVIQARIESNRGLSAGGDFMGDARFWMKPFGSWADQDDRKGVSGFEADTWGLALGADFARSSSTRLGLAFAYAKANVDGNSNVAPQQADVEVFQLVGYGSYALDDRTEVNFQVDFGRNNNEGRRTIAFTSTVAESDYHSTTAHVGVGIGRVYPVNTGTTFTPSVRADYTWIRDESYTETGAGLLNLDVDSRHTDELILAVDGKLAHALSSRSTLIANLGVGYDVLNERASITAAYAGAPGAAFVTRGLDPSPWLVRAGLGVIHQLEGGAELVARYDAEHRSDFLNQTASVKVRWAF
ncbi:MAG: autotransporter outer membrane beta-barrel domain-containing protein [Pseudomonadota bacterium]